MHAARSKVESSGRRMGGTMGGTTGERQGFSYQSNGIPDGIPDGIPEASPSEHSGFSGTFETTLMDWIQLVQMGRRDAVINVRGNDGKEGTLWLRDGDIIDATCDGATGDGLTGEDAVLRALSWQRGRVSVEFASINRRRRIQTATAGLLLRAAYRQDTQDLAPPPGLDNSAPTRETPQVIRRAVDLRFAIGGGLAVVLLLLFSGLVVKWVAWERPGDPTNGMRDAPSQPHVVPRPAATTTMATRATPTSGNPIISSHAAVVQPVQRLTLAPSTATRAAPAHRRAVTAQAKRSSGSSSSGASPALSERARSSAPAPFKLEIIEQDQPRIQVIQERQPRIQIIQERQPRVEEIN